MRAAFLVIAAARLGPQDVADLVGDLPSIATAESGDAPGQRSSIPKAPSPVVEEKDVPAETMQVLLSHRDRGDVVPPAAPPAAALAVAQQKAAVEHASDATVQLAATMKDKCASFAGYLKAQATSGVALVRTFKGTCDPAVASGEAPPNFVSLCNNTAFIPAFAQDLALYKDAPDLAGSRKALYISVKTETEKLAKMMRETPHDMVAEADYLCDKVKDQMAKVRSLVDETEGILEKGLYPYPTYESMLYHHHH